MNFIISHPLFTRLFRNPMVVYASTREPWNPPQQGLDEGGLEDDVVIDCKGYWQGNDYACGFIAGATVLSAFRPEASLARFWDRIQPNVAWGLGNRKMSNALRKYGIGVSDRVDLTWHEIATQLEEGFPIATCIKYELGIHHWITLYGVNRRRREVFVADGCLLLGKHRFPWKEFRRAWATVGCGLVCWQRG